MAFNKEQVLVVIRRMLSSLGYDVYSLSDAELIADLEKLVQVLKRDL